MIVIARQFPNRPRGTLADDRGVTSRTRALFDPHVAQALFAAWRASSFAVRD